MNIESMTKDEKSLLLFFETCAVDRSGRVNSQYMNGDDRRIAEKWNETGFVEFGRICFEDANEKSGTNWCWLSDDAWKIAHTLRCERGKRSWKRRTYRTTGEVYP